MSPRATSPSATLKPARTHLGPVKPWFVEYLIGMAKCQLVEMFNEGRARAFIGGNRFARELKWAAGTTRPIRTIRSILQKNRHALRKQLALFWLE